MSTLNFDSLTVGQNGRVAFSGLGSGIDIHGTVDKIIEAKRIPIDRIEQRISDREAKIAAFKDMQSAAVALRDAVAKLRGAVSVDKANDVFEAKQAFATTSRSDAETPSEAAELVGVTVTNAAQATGHTLEILQVAKAHKVASDSVAGGIDDDLGLDGTFTVNGETITAETTDSLLDLRDKINAANPASGVTASVVSISETEHVLVLSADATGTDATIDLADTTGSVLADFGVLDGGAIKNELQAAQNAEIQVDGLGTTITRQSNTVDDVFAGVTISLFKAEPGTTVELGVERDLGQVKQAVVDVVEAYNDLRRFINEQAQTDVPADDESGAGILAGTSALSEIRARLSGAVGAAVAAEDPALSVLAQVGITIQGEGAVADPLDANTLAIDESTLDEALLNDFDAVRELFTFGLASSSSNVRLAGFDGNTSFKEGGYTLNVAYAGGEIVSANIDGPADGSDNGTVVVDGKVLSVTDGGAEGLTLLYSGTESASGIQLDVSIGVGAQMYHEVDALVDKTTGMIASEIETLEEQNTLGEERIERLDQRLERERERLLERFVAMETALTTMNRLMDSLAQQIESAFGTDR